MSSLTFPRLSDFESLSYYSLLALVQKLLTCSSAIDSTPFHLQGLAESNRCTLVLARSDSHLALSPHSAFQRLAGSALDDWCLGATALCTHVGILRELLGTTEHEGGSPPRLIVRRLGSVPVGACLFAQLPVPPHVDNSHLGQDAKAGSLPRKVIGGR